MGGKGEKKGLRGQVKLVVGKERMRKKLKLGKGGRRLSQQAG